jgi:uncharacterized protein involved in tolerance to divalent cations
LSRHLTSKVRENDPIFRDGGLAVSMGRERGYGRAAVCGPHACGRKGGRRETVTSDEFSLLYVTTDDVEEATALARVVVAAGLAACANVLPDVMPVFRIDDEVAAAPGAAFLVMTRAGLVARAVQFLE